MRTDTVTKQRILRDVIISIFIYALPVLLMLLSFKITGQRPWKDKPNTSIQKN